MELAATQRRIIFRAAATALILAALAIVSGRRPAALGVLTGCLAAILNFRLLALSIAKLLDLPPRAAQIQAALRYIIRYLLMAAVLWSVNLNPDLDLYAAVVGLLLVKAVILGEAFCTFLGQKLRSTIRWEKR